jgi:hypothetical protein
VVLFGSGETSPSGQKVFDRLFRQLPKNPQVSLLETPAGFELNSAQVAGKVADFFHHNLQNYHPQIEIIPARKRDTNFSPDNQEIAYPLLKSDLIFAGPGSPTYAVRQLQDSLTWHYLLARHRLGSAITFSSSTVIAISTHALPVYEIYKVGEDPHWKPGLNLFGPYWSVSGLPLVFIPHWNNNDGGDELDTSRCYIGRARFEPLLEMLPDERVVIGIDEHTALWLDCAGLNCKVFGLGTITMLKDGEKHIFSKGDSFSFSDLMDCHIPDPAVGIPQHVWQVAQAATQTKFEEDTHPTEEVLDLVEQRTSARNRKDWTTADELRDRIAALGWQVKDTPEGAQIVKL